MYSTDNSSFSTKLTLYCGCSPHTGTCKMTAQYETTCPLAYITISNVSICRHCSYTHSNQQQT